MFIVKTACAKMPRNCWGTYRRVAVMEIYEGMEPSMISVRAHGVKKIVRTWEKCHARKRNPKSNKLTAYERALNEARTLADQLNNAKE